MSSQSNQSRILKEGHFSALEVVGENPGITAIELGKKIHISRYTALNYAERLCSLNYLIRTLFENGTYSFYLAPHLTPQTVEQLIIHHEKNMMDSLKSEQSISSILELRTRLLTLSPVRLKTLKNIAKHGKITCQELADLEKTQIHTASIHKRTLLLLDEGFILVEKDPLSRRNIYSLASPYTYEMLFKALNFNPSGQSSISSEPQKQGKVIAMPLNNETHSSAVPNNFSQPQNHLEKMSDTEILLLIFETLSQLDSRLGALENRLDGLEQQQSTDEEQNARERLHQHVLYFRNRA